MRYPKFNKERDTVSIVHENGNPNATLRIVFRGIIYTETIHHEDIKYYQDRIDNEEYLDSLMDYIINN
jgi:hypothetical protein